MKTCNKVLTAVPHDNLFRIIAGALLLDEMKLSEAIAFSKVSLRTVGLVNLGKYTPEAQKDEMGDHALVLMYQPFQGSYYQPIAAFLSKGAAPGAVLEKIVLEAILLLEKAEFFVDEVVTDGGPWNRAMWKLFNINKNNPSCEHPADHARRLWFTSDFPHLMKTLWSRVRCKGILKVSLPQIMCKEGFSPFLSIWLQYLHVFQLQTPDGLVQFKHWVKLVEADENRQIKRCPFLSKDHIKPQKFQTMNVKMAFTVSST